MSRKELYEICELCGGARLLPPDARVCVDPPGSLERAEDGRNFICPSCHGRGFIATGLSVAQVERIIRDLDQVKARVAELEGHWSAW